MIPKDCNCLAEVDFPIAVVSKHSAGEKSIRHAHPSILHLEKEGHPLKGPLSRDKQSVTENLIEYFPFVFLRGGYSGDIL
jgi:hypothetical protein